MTGSLKDNKCKTLSFENLKVTCVVKNCLYEIEGNSLAKFILNFAKHYKEAHQ